jgi:predicted PurR-regulated permease PerM
VSSGGRADGRSTVPARAPETMEACAMKPELVTSTDNPRADAAVSEPIVPTVRMPVDARGLSLSILAVTAAVFLLEWAQVFFVSLLLGILIAYMLNPLVVWLERIRIPRAVATLIVMLGVVGALVLGVYSLRGQMQTIVEQVPAAASKFSAGLNRLRNSQYGTMQKMQTAATEVEKATSQVTSAAAAPKQPATHVVVDPPAFKLGDALWTGSKGAMGAAGQAVMVLFLTFFLLVGGDTFKRKMVRLTGPSLSKRKITVQIIDDINDSIQKYLFMMLSTNVLVGLLVWVAFAWIGLENAGAWAVAAGFLHVIPYLGPGVTAAATGMAAFMQFDSFPMALLVAGASMAIATLVGTFVTTWMTGRIARMNAAAIFISLLFWGWLWGVWGMLLSIPIIVIVKVVSEHVEQLGPVAELLGD